MSLLEEVTFEEKLTVKGAVQLAVCEEDHLRLE